MIIYNNLLLDNDKINNMNFGAFNNISYYGYKSSILKSGICKYFRREIFDKFEFCIIEMMIFGIKNKGLLTNTINRLKILLMEEIVCINAGDLCECIIILNNIDNFNFEEKICKILELCSILKKFKRARICSYLNNWWKLNNIKYDLNNINLNKISKFKKKNDTNELLKYGELFINYLENNDEKMFNIYQILYDFKGTFGNRYRRKDAVYLLFEIVENKHKNNKKFMEIFNFIKNMFFKKNMTERRAFGIWLILFTWKYTELNFTKQFTKDIFDIEKLKLYFSKRTKLILDDDFVINDYHVNKKHGLAKFGLIGSHVVNEDLNILGDNGNKYKKLYIENKIKQEEKLSNKKYNNNKEFNFKEELEFIDWSKFTNIKVLEEGVCGLKVCCIKVIYNNNNYILKEMRKSFNYGRDYELVDSLKKHFDIKEINMVRIKSNIGLDLIDKNKKSFVNNWKFGKRDVIYCMMNEFENIGDIGKNKTFLKNKDIFEECLKIRLFDGLLRSSDNIQRNILVNKDRELLSIDEGDIYGKRKKIFNDKDFFKRKENLNITIKYSEKIINNWNLNNKIDIIKLQLKKFGFNDKICEMEERVKNYKNIVNNELIIKT